MEGNLSRARSSLYMTPSSNGSDASTPSPPFQRTSTTIHSQVNDSSAQPHSASHSRMSSDIAMRNGLPYRVSIPRSQSALGAAGGYRQPLPTSKSAEHIRTNFEPTRPTYRINPVRDGTLKRLTVDEVARLEEPDRATQNARLENFLSPTFGTFSDSGSNGMRGGLQRSTSAAQMRDIKDQMKDLKGKISSLREQARVDSLKRRSLQSLRTPSPFTHSQIGQWHAEPQSQRNSTNSDSGDGPTRNPWNGDELSVDGDRQEDPERPTDAYPEDLESVYNEVEHTAEIEPAGNASPERMSIPLSRSSAEKVDTEAGVDDVSDMHTENGDFQEDDEGSIGFQDALDVGYESESGESLYHDTVLHQISHEDREDAFDYEHFFLHSAMGTMSQRRLHRRGSTDTFTSEESVETTRGLAMEASTTAIDDDEPSNGPNMLITTRSRRNSNASISTVETFATAQEVRPRKPYRGNSQDSDVAMESASSGHRASASSSPCDIEVRSGGTKTGLKSPFGSVGGHSSMVGIKSAATTRNSDDSISSIPEEGPDEAQIQHTSRRLSAFRRPMSF